MEQTVQMSDFISYTVSLLWVKLCYGILIRNVCLSHAGGGGGGGGGGGSKVTKPIFSISANSQKNRKNNR